MQPITFPEVHTGGESMQLRENRSSDGGRVPVTLLLGVFKTILVAVIHYIVANSCHHVLNLQAHGCLKGIIGVQQAFPHESA